MKSQTIDSFQELKEILQTGNIPDDISHFTEASSRRLLTALRDSASSADIASLLRHVLRREDERQGGKSHQLKVPRKHPFGDRASWQRAGITVLSEGIDYYLITANAWQPDWLELSDVYAPDGPVCEEQMRRDYESVVGDPFLEIVKRETYRNIGQQEAIRAVLTAPEKSTLVINLPTGSGKSLCAQLPALLESRIAGVSVVVVPTTALAIDQERALKPFIYPTAYYGDESVAGQERRDEIRDRIRDGTQRIIFTSPESLLGSLASSLYEAANLGMLRYFVIDEAHMVEQWGDDFRPAFQEIPGLRKDLLRLASFTTLLLTATLTESCLDTLETLFGEPDRFQVLSAVQLRPEPAYWFAWCRSEETRKQRLLEAIYHLPRPLIVYGTKVADVKSWAKELSRAGFTRYGVMTGQSSSEEREKLIQNWQENKIDIVVATSAFGLGIDQADVRAVIHACIPETIDRFYQEVGRGGRDGKASISLTLHTTQDLKVAKTLNEKSTITIKRGQERWQSMFARKTIVSGKGFRVPIDIPPSLEAGDIDMDSKQNTAWNIRTLTLMNRTGLIEIDSEKPPLKKDFELEADYLAAHKNHQNSRIIRIRNESHLDNETWELQVEPVRHQRQNWSYKNLQLMREALQAKRCLSEIFNEAYSIPRRQSAPRSPVNVSRACGGCPVCRKNGVPPSPGIMPIPKPVWQKPKFFVGEELQRLLAGDKLLLIFYESWEELNKLGRGNRLFKWLIGQGIRNIVVPPEYRKLIQDVNRIPEAFIFLFENDEPLRMPDIPTLVFYSHLTSISGRYILQNMSNAPRIIFLPMNTADPNREDRRLFNIFSGRALKFESLCMEISL